MIKYLEFLKIVRKVKGLTLLDKDLISVLFVCIGRFSDERKTLDIWQKIKVFKSKDYREKAIQSFYT